MPSSLPAEEQPQTAQPQPSPQPAAPPPSDTKARSLHALISFGASALFISFFLPCINIMGAKLNGWDIQRNFSSYQIIWVMPLLAALVFVLNAFRVKTDIVRYLAGLFCILGYAIHTLGKDVIQALEGGAWLGLTAGLALILIPSPHKPSTPA